MTLVRRHLVGAVVLVLALATGIALGAGPLSHEAWVPTTASPPPTTPAVDQGPTADDLAEVAAASLHGTRLEGRAVALLSTPGVDTGVIDALVTGVEEADGAVVARWTAGESLVSPHEKALVDTLGSQLLEQLDGEGASADASAYQRMGQLIGSAVASRGSAGSVPDRDTLTIRQSMDAASLLTTGADEARRAPLLLLVLGDDLDDYVVSDLVAGLASRASGVVVAGPARAGDLKVLAEEVAAVTTVDGVEGAAGRLAAVLALARVEKSPGDYGASGSDGLLPLG